ncbi:hypothetical protein ACJ41O_013017 [Fusarium nematophilum]
MLSFKTLLSVATIAGLHLGAQASYLEDVAENLGVTVADIFQLQASTKFDDIDVNIWTHPFGQDFADNVTWTDDLKATYLGEVKLAINDGLCPELSKRQNAAAQAAVKDSSAKAMSDRDRTHRRLLDLSCAKGTRTACLFCKGLYPAAYIGADGVCSAGALLAAADTADALTPAAAVGPASCLTLATAAFGTCVSKCIG